MSAPALIEEQPYTVAIAGVRIAAATLQQAQIIAENEREAWKALNYRSGRVAKIYYRDGSLVLTIGGEE